MQPEASRNVSFLGHSDQGGRGDGVQVMVHKGYAYVGHGYSNGISVIDVRDPRRPKTVGFLPCPPNTRAIHLQAHGDLLLAVNGPSVWTMQVDPQAYYSSGAGDSLKGRQFTAGVRVFDIARPEAPREIGFMATPGIGPHRIWYVGGRYAYVSIHTPEFTDQVLTILDMAEPTRPEPVGRWWLPGMWSGGGETPTWPQGKRYALHHALVAGSIAYGAWRDGGLTVLDVADPTQPRLLAHRNTDPPFGGGTHSPLPLPDRNLLVLADEANFQDCAQGLRHIWLFDVRAPSNPVSFATLPVPDETDYCAKGGNFGPHNLWENRPGAFQSSRYIFATYHNAGVRIFDIANPLQPREAGYFVPPPPARMFDPRPNRPQVIQSADCFVDSEGRIYLTDNNAGLYILQFEAR